MHTTITDLSLRSDRKVTSFSADSSFFLVFTRVSLSGRDFDAGDVVVPAIED